LSCGVRQTENWEYEGKYVQSLLTDEEYQRFAIPNMQSDTAKKVKALVWSELIGELRKRVPGLDELIRV
jgi:hypothetical protein